MKTRVIFLCACFLVLSARPFFAQDGVSLHPDSSAVFDQKISLDLRDIDVNEALKFLATKSGLNLIATKNVAGRVTLSVADVAVKDVFDIMLRSNSLAYDRQGEIYNIMTETEYKALYGKSFADMRQVKVFRLQYAIPEQAFTFLDAVKSEIGRVLVDSESGNVLIMDTSENIRKMQDALAEFEKKNLVEVFVLKYAKAKDVEDALKTQLDSKKVGYVKADERSNQIIVQTLPERMEEVRRLVGQLDKQTKQVVIETKILKINLSDQFNSGLTWEGLFATARRKGLTYVGSYPFSSMQAAADPFRTRMETLANVTQDVGSYPFSGTTSSYASSTKTTLGENLHVGMFDKNRDFDVLMQYLQTLGNTRILFSPKIVATNNQEAKIHVGERRAYVTSTTTTGQATSTVSEEVTFIDVGIQLSVTPTINDDGYITMKIKPEISSVIDTLITANGNKIPIVDTSMAETTVMIQDGTTLVLGGMRKEEKTKSTEQFPILGNLPFVGNFFKSEVSKTARTELMVLLTPHIITGAELDTGNEREFGDKPGKAYRDYQAIVTERQNSSSDVPPEVTPKGLTSIEEGPEMERLMKQEVVDTYGTYRAYEEPLPQNKTVLGQQQGRSSAAGASENQEGFGIKEIKTEENSDDDNNGTGQ